jgi:hypothetical protein
MAFFPSAEVAKSSHNRIKEVKLLINQSKLSYWLTNNQKIFFESKS